MNDKQHTVKAPVTVRGIGLHTGAEATMTFCPAPVGHGYKFQRVDLPGQPVVDADVDNVVDLSRGTTIEQNGARINTVEHTLAALVGLQLDNVLIQLSGPEPPIMDGSSAEFIKALHTVGFEEQNALRNYYEIPDTIRYMDNARGVEIAALPLADYRLTVMVDYNSPVLGSQHATLTDIGQFENEISSSRTFCFLHELEHLYKSNLIKGGDLSNAIVVVDRVVGEHELDELAAMLGKPKVSVKKEGILNNVDLRHKNEPARHKLLDLVGDLALVGRPLKGQILAARPGHAANVAFAKRIKKRMLEDRTSAVPLYDPAREPVMDINRIMQVLPHRYPFLLLDKVIHLDSQMVTAVKNITMNEPFFQGHFPGNPVMPGVLQIEAMAQTGGILVMNTVPDPENYWQYFLGIENARFRKKVLPGDTVIFHCVLTAPIKRGIAKMKGQAFVNGKVVCDAEMSAAIVRKDNV
ncbi:MAG: bifunctional UDP-3-O-[3-hydroxymyristoyl] N-acetylglucosamine deacetylase/3-hydroxyacyl-ACP dehydratase [Hymenobacter sp.]|nr:MAG: bifunctional UDP-3-O-[3-hydroxymyristoyl] N-acetylglucosamine deacetylase/3-hydroxyacyl-ACP dehydratase [Hymenobacter sp.]